MLFLEFARRQRGWSQTQLSQVSRVFTTFISLAERGQGLPTREQRQRLADALDIPPDLLLKPVSLVDVHQAQVAVER